MNINHRKKQIERFFLERFLEASGMVAEIVNQDERPDFVIILEGRLVGVELTRIFISHSSSVLQSQESNSDKIVFGARKIYESLDGYPAHISVFFASSCELQRISRDDTARQLANVVKEMELGKWSYVDWRPESLDSLGNVISIVHALGVPDPEMAHWGVVRAGWTAPLTVAQMQARINEKALLLAHYRKKVNENWLLIYSDGMKPSQLFELEAEFDASKLTSPFEKTYYFGHPERTLLELGHKS
ncbi:MAG: hypothetical protein VBE63_29345 [Lamprobacter sp.]|uniref:hypothetical protein n=1 Tax=Lamprobacter sp. TaxID=3100796 RepID=UPI002B258D69|nr:hypothetical protein [Lamprobacter sp.]MEA3643997.1 hypothetical protein [Lamprobacter sp.]